MPDSATQKPVSSKEYLERLKQRRAERRTQPAASAGFPDTKKTDSVPQSEATQPDSTDDDFMYADAPELEQSRVAPGLYKPQPEFDIFIWKAPSRPFKKRQRQYYTTVGVITLLVSMILFFAGQVLPVAVVLSVAFLVYVLSVVPPHEVQHKITSYGIRIEGTLYYWEELGRFWFTEKHGIDILNLETVRFPGRLALLLGESITKPNMKAILSEVLLYQKPELTQFEKMAEWLKKKFPLET